ncbi:MAG: YfhO family protein, partial [Burkholderiales bacterium]|nr:YfhO family protein [Anaerolineae bacterium]
FIAGWGMWAFTGRLGLPTLGRGMSALAFGMTSYLVARLGTYPMIAAAAWLPWLLWAAYGVMKDGRRRDVAWLALFAALQLLAGHAQTTWYALALVGLFVLWRWLYARREWVRVVMIVLGLALAVGVAALQLLATAELLSQSQRSDGVDFDFAMNYSYGPVRTLNFLNPDVFGTPADGSYITEGAFFEDAVYIGLIPLVSAFAALFGWRRRRREGQQSALWTDVPFWWVIVIVAFVFALGKNTPIFPFLYRNIPTFDLFQAPVRWHLWTVFALSVLAGIGTQAWPRGGRKTRWAIVGGFGAAAVAFAVLALGLLPVEGAAGEGIRVLIGAVVTTGILGAVAGLLTLRRVRDARWSVLVLIVVAADLTWAAKGLNPTVPGFDIDASAIGGRGYWLNETLDPLQFETYFTFDDYRPAVAKWDVIRESNLPDLNLLHRAPLLNNFEPLLVGHHAEYVDLIEAATLEQRFHLLQAASVDGLYPLTDLSEANAYSPSAWLVGSVCWHSSEESLREALLNADWNPLTQVHILGEGDCPAAPDEVTVEPPFWSGDTGRIEIQSVEGRDSWLVVADTDYPGWEATVYGEPVAISRANLAFRAIPVPAGPLTVRFEYHPWWLLPGTVISVVSLLLLLTLFRISTEYKVQGTE